jgi:hypothetical protein
MNTNINIQRLAREAGVSLDHENQLEFAELIVSECVRVLTTEIGTWAQLGSYQGSMQRQAARALREHFGLR